MNSEKVVRDTWSNYNRSHRFWILSGPTLSDPQVNVRCARCGQTRKVWAHVDLDGDVRWGCPSIPAWYRFRLWLNVKEIPGWDCNTIPPWIKKKERKR